MLWMDNVWRVPCFLNCGSHNGILLYARHEHLKVLYTLARANQIKVFQSCLTSWRECLAFFEKLTVHLLQFHLIFISSSSLSLPNNQYFQVCEEQAHRCQSLCKQVGQRGLVVRGCTTHTTRQMLYSYWAEVHAGIDRLGQYLPVFGKQRSLANPSYTDSELCLWFAQTIKARHFCID